MCKIFKWFILANGDVSEGLLLLLAGKKLYKKVDIKNLLETASSDYGFFAWLSEINSTHPHLSSRIKNILSMNKKMFGIETDLIGQDVTFKPPILAIILIAVPILLVILGIILTLILPDIIMNLHQAGNI